MKGLACGRKPHDQKLSTVMYASVLSKEAVRIASMIAAFNNLEVKLDDILSAYIRATVMEKVWSTLSSYLGKDARKTAMTVRALYGLK